MSKHFDLQAVMLELQAGDIIGRRNYEAYREWAKLERDWLEVSELGHLKRAMVYAKKRNRSLKQSLERTKPNVVREANDPPQEPASLSEMALELRALRTASESSTNHQDALIARLQTEDAYYTAWEVRLRRNEEEVNTLWDIIEELIRLGSASAPRLEKLERRVGYQYLRQANPQASKPRAKSAS